MTAEEEGISLSGGCRCGRVRYEGRARRLRNVVCACIDCQRSSGSFLSVAVGALRESFRIAEGESSLGSYADTGESGQPVHRFFCRECGSPLFGKPDSYPEFVSVRTISLDDPLREAAAFAIFTENIPEWLRLEGVPKGD